MDVRRLASSGRELCRAVVDGRDAVPELLRLIADELGARAVELSVIDTSSQPTPVPAFQAVMLVERSLEHVTVLSMRRDCAFSSDELEAVALLATALGASLRARDALGSLQLLAGARGTVGLTRRQAEVVELVASGMTNDQVAHRLGVSSRTVRKHVALLFDRTGARSRTELAVRWTAASRSGVPLTAAR